jgi:UDP-2,3-diacylglucosamine pyrophosphatase LpxH
MSAPFCDTLIVSDLHLGSGISRAQDATRMLRQQCFRRLILLGDIFADLNFRRLTKAHWKFLSYIRKLSNPKREVEVVWVEGNHDRGLSSVMSHLVGVKVYQEYAWNFDGLRHLAIHGHQFDRFVVNNLLLSGIGSFIHLQLQKLDLESKFFSRALDRLNTRWLRLSSKVAAGAINHARLRGAGRVFCGHTHAALRTIKDGVEYYNAGSWTDSRPTYITVGSDGVNIHEYREPADDCDTGEERGAADSQLAEFAAEAGLSEDVEYESVGG